MNGGGGARKRQVLRQVEMNLLKAGVQKEMCWLNTSPPPVPPPQPLPQPPAPGRVGSINTAEGRRNDMACAQAGRSTNAGKRTLAASCSTMRNAERGRRFGIWGVGESGEQQSGNPPHHHSVAWRPTGGEGPDHRLANMGWLENGCWLTPPFPPHIGVPAAGTGPSWGRTNRNFKYAPPQKKTA